VAQHRPVAARQHGGPAPADDTDHAMADGIDAPVDRVQPSRTQPPVPARRAQPQRHQLPASHDAALTAGEYRDRPVDDDFASHTDA
jgi:hypothetical protein